jgi:type II secretion system protein F
MPQFRYTARDERGQARTGTLAADTPEALADTLRRQGFLVTGVQPVSEGAAATAGGGRRVKADDLVLLSVQLAKMVQVGIPLVSALDTLGEQASRPQIRAVMQEVARSVQGGLSFSQALARHPRTFSPLFVNMVRAGEASGKLDEVLRRLADHGRRQVELRNQLVTALSYPALLVVFGVGVCVFLVMSIIPKFVAIFQEAGVVLPAPTALLHQVSLLLRQGWLGLLLGAAALAGAWSWARRVPAFRLRLDAAALRVPVVGELLREGAICQLARTLETLFASGVPILEALEIAEGTCGNRVLAETLKQVQANVRRGGALTEPLRRSGQFPPMVVQMLSIGEASGALDAMLREVAEHYEELVQHGVKRVMALLEPALLIVMGGLVAFIMASVLLPLFRMVNVIR